MGGLELNAGFLFFFLVWLNEMILFWFSVLLWITYKGLLIIWSRRSVDIHISIFLKLWQMNKDHMWKCSSPYLHPHQTLSWWSLDVEAKGKGALDYLFFCFGSPLPLCWGHRLWPWAIRLLHVYVPDLGYTLQMWHFSQVAQWWSFVT